MSIITIILVIVLVGFLMEVINSLIPMQPNIKRILNIVVIAFLIFWLLKVFGLIASLQSIHI